MNAKIRNAKIRKAVDAMVKLVRKNSAPLAIAFRLTITADEWDARFTSVRGIQSVRKGRRPLRAMNGTTIASEIDGPR